MMDPLRKSPQQASFDGNVEGIMQEPQQFGRSTTSLHAERESSTIAQELNRTRSADSVPSSRPTSFTHATSTPSLPSTSSGPSNPRRASYVPTTPSPLNPSSSGSISSGSSDERRLSEGKRSSGSLRGSATLHREAVTKNIPPPPPPRGPQQPRIANPELGSNNPFKKVIGSPSSIEHLGSSYTRYFNPFSDSRRSSTSSFADVNSSHTYLPRYAADPKSPSASAPLLNKRQHEQTRSLSEKEALASFFPFLDDRLGAPFNEKDGIKFPLFTDEKEDDDDLHMPYADDDVKLKPLFKDRFNRDTIASTLGLVFMVIGLLFVFVGIPVLSFAGFIRYGVAETPLDQMWHPGKAETWAIVNNNSYPLMSNIRTGLIDPDTPQSAYTRTSINGTELELVFSDEFNDNNRTFYEGDDPYWFAPDIWYGATIDLEWYDPDAVTTYGGVLELRLDRFPNHGVQYRSGMLNSWNQLCFKGGVFEVSVSLPGPAGTMAFWPGAWTMGNLGRPGYLSTTEGLWPYTYNDCDAGITPNQSMSDGTSRLPGQRLNACTCPGEDHPTPGTGRGAPEIDIFEAGANGRGLGIVTQSYQVAPFDIWYYPDYDFMEFPDYGISYPNGYTGGPFQQAISATTNLNNDWYDGKQYQSYSFEYVPGTGRDAYVAWYVGKDMTFMMNGDAIGPNGNIGYRQVSEEPMSMVLNFGFSTAWTFIDYPAIANVFPNTMRIDYVRWYQPKDNHMVTCDPPGYETTQYIKDHLNAYTNPNFTVSLCNLLYL